MDCWTGLFNQIHGFLNRLVQSNPWIFEPACSIKSMDCWIGLSNQIHEMKSYPSWLGYQSVAPTKCLSHRKISAFHTWSDSPHKATPAKAYTKIWVAYWALDSVIFASKHASTWKPQDVGIGSKESLLSSQHLGIYLELFIFLPTEICQSRNQIGFPSISWIFFILRDFFCPNHYKCNMNYKVIAWVSPSQNTRQVI